MIKIAYFGIATLSLGIGILGIVLPLLPTTPFLLLSAACYAKSSTRHYHWFISIPWIGKNIENYYEGKGITAKGKIISIGFLWASIVATMIIMQFNSILKFLLFIVLVSVTLHILSLKTIKSRPEENI